MVILRNVYFLIEVEWGILCRREIIENKNKTSYI